MVAGLLAKMQPIKGLVGLLALGACVALPLALKEPGIYKYDSPFLVEELANANLVSYADTLFLVPHGIAVRWTGEDLYKNRSLKVIRSFNDLKAALEVDK